MTFLTTDDILNTVQLQIIDNSTVTRSRLLAWMNLAMRTIVQDRDWEFLKTVVSKTPANNCIDLTSETAFDRIFSFRNGSFCLYKVANISDEQQTIEQNNVNTSVPRYFKQISSQVFQFFPGISNDSVSCTYIKTFTDYTDTNQTTIFPTTARNLIVRMVLTTFYEFDADERMLPSSQMVNAELRNFRDWDNRMKPQVDYNNVIGGRNYVNG